MQLRRALFLFAIVLGLAAVAASLAPAPDDRREGEPPRARTQPAQGARAAEPGPVVTFRAAAEQPSRRRIATGEQVTVRVETAAPGQVEIPQLGLLQFATPDTPAVFDVLVPSAGRYEVTYTGNDAPVRRIGVLEVVAPVS